MKIGILGGSGLYEIEGFEHVKEMAVHTPFGAPSEMITTCRRGEHLLYFLPRHGRGHRILPSEINHRANIYALKELGCERIISVSAVGSLREDYRPGDLAFPNQYFDRTKKSLEHTFFGKGIVGHIPFGDPVCNEWRAQAMQAARTVIKREKCTSAVHDGGTYVNMEGPAFSTRAESDAYRQLGFDLIGMTSLGEAKLSREAGLCYCCLAMVTDYDCWHDAEEGVNVESVLDIMRKNVSTAQHALVELVDHLEATQCTCSKALENAIMTSADRISPEHVVRLSAVFSKWV